MFFTRMIRDDSRNSKIIQICLSQSIRHRNQVVRINLLEIILFYNGSTKSKTTYIEKMKCRNLRHRIIGIDVTCSKLLRMLLILLGFLSTVNICYQESEREIIKYTITAQFTNPEPHPVSCTIAMVSLFFAPLIRCN